MITTQNTKKNERPVNMNFHDIWTIAKKELRSCFSDKIILAQIIILPFVIVFGYTILMSITSESQKNNNDTDDITAYYINALQYMNEGFENLGIRAAEIDELENLKNDIENKKCDLLVVFPEDFQISAANSENLSDIQIWYNTENKKSVSALNNANAYLSMFQPSVFTVNSDSNVKYDLGDENAVFRGMLGTILPIMIFMAVFIVCMNLAAESIAGDKERGFLNTMLISPVSRSSIAAGKSLCVFITAIIGGISAFIGMSVSLPRLAKSMGMENVTYSISEYILLFAVTITAIFVLVGLLLVISALAKDVKQATNIAPVFLMIFMVAAMLTMNDNFSQAVSDLGVWNFTIPAWNTMMIMKDIIETDYSAEYVLISCLSNLIFTAIAIFAVGKCFENERIING